MHPLCAYMQRFVPLTDAQWAPLAAVLRPVHLARHAHFVAAGQRRAEFGLVLSGALRP